MVRFRPIDGYRTGSEGSRRSSWRDYTGGGIRARPSRRLDAASAPRPALSPNHLMLRIAGMFQIRILFNNPAVRSNDHTGVVMIELSAL